MAEFTQLRWAKKLMEEKVKKMTESGQSKYSEKELNDIYNFLERELGKYYEDSIELEWGVTLHNFIEEYIEVWYSEYGVIKICSRI